MSMKLNFGIIGIGNWGKNLIRDFSKLKFKDYFYNYKKYMNLIEYSELRNLIFD